VKLRPFGNESVHVSEIGLGCWQLGGSDWGDLPEAEALAVLRAAADTGVTFLDTADVYGLGRSEEIVGRFLKEAGRRRFFVATKLGRFPQPGWPGNFAPAAIRAHTESSLRRLGVDAIDLTQLHCVPMEVLLRDETWETLRALVREGKIRRFGASVESVAEAKECVRQADCASLQLIVNVFRQTPVAELFDRCEREGVAVIVRLPLASGLLAGRYTPTTTFPPEDHRTYNRDGAAFNVGETFAGLPFETGVHLVERLRPLVPSGDTMAQFAIRWCLDHPAVTTVIPGARTPDQARANAAAAALPPLPADLHARLCDFFRTEVRPHVRGPD
jgi:aryl-alcohol dehydrogenase-like predicted oxidoreductase